MYKLCGDMTAAAQHHPATSAPSAAAAGRVEGKCLNWIQFLVVRSPTLRSLSVERCQGEGGVGSATGGLVEPHDGDNDEAGGEQLSKGDDEEGVGVKSGRMPM